ncbi:Rab-GTPase-TBC domain family protein [Leishmania donovani]|uniref:Rab-GTPase-TBC domain family protein n=1 Tax=Leishmania donovani TaxID=5661 RepID=A0A504XUA4_LEIDO|nr:Rab-GTPase-TBC domain family protein [Leishmania donovani]
MSRPRRFSPLVHSPRGVYVQSPLAGEPEVGMANDGRIFEELLDAEVAVNMEKLREASRMGIPPAYRGVVYRYLLGVAFTDKSSEMTMEELQDKDFQLLNTAYTRMELLTFSTSSAVAAVSATEGSGPLHCSSGFRGIGSGDAGGGTGGGSSGAGTVATPFVYRGPSAVPALGPSATLAAWEECVTALRYCEPYNADARQWARMESALAALQMMYCNVSVDHVQLIVLLARQLDRVASSARDTFFTVHALFDVLTQDGNILHDAHTLQTHCGNFLMLFRSVLLPLYEHFTVEGLTTWEWIPSLLTCFFVGRMHPDDVFALWDYYLADMSEHQAMALHPYACLAMLSSMTEVLIEAGKIELLYCLEHLPRLDTAAIMRKAVLIRESVYSKELLCG